MSICAENEMLSDSDYLRRLSSRLSIEHSPTYGSMALTNRCNVRCHHCYARPATSNGDAQTGEMDTATHLRILDEITREGCLFLLLTGGEPLLRPDFSEIYTRAKKNGLIVTVFTNGTLVDDRIMALFSDLPPRRVEISIYGATAATHDGITGVIGSFLLARRAADRLVSIGLQVTLKTVLMTRNLTEFDDMKSVASEHGATFRYDPLIFPRMNGDRAPLALRLSPEEIVNLDFSDPEKVRSWQNYEASHRDMPVTNRLYCCGAGVTCFWIDPYGNLSPCVMARRIIVNIADGAFAPAWKNIVFQMKRTVESDQFACVTCNKKALCGYCPGFLEVETGSETKPSDFLCSIGRLRLQFLTVNHHKEAEHAS